MGASGGAEVCVLGVGGGSGAGMGPVCSGLCRTVSGLPLLSDLLAPQQ